MNRYPSRTFRSWCAGLIVLVFSWSLSGAVEARVSPIELVKLQLRKPNFLIVVETPESMQGLPGENPARYNEVGEDCEKGDRFCRLYGQKGRCEFSGMGAQGAVFDDVPMGTNTTTSTTTKTGGIQVITNSDTRVETSYATEISVSTGANSSGQTGISTDTGTQTSIGTQSINQTGTSFGTETYNQTGNQTGIQTVNATGTITGTQTYNTTSTVTGTQSYNTTSTVTGTQSYNTTSTVTGTQSYNTTSTVTGTQSYNTTSTVTGTSTYAATTPIAFDAVTSSNTWAGSNWSIPHPIGSGKNRMLVIFTAASGSGDLAYTNVQFNGKPAKPLTTSSVNLWGNYGQIGAWAVKESDLPGTGGSYNVTGTNPTGSLSNVWMMAISFSGVSQADPTWASTSENSAAAKTQTVSKTATGTNDWFLDAILIWETSNASTITPAQTFRTSQGATSNGWYLGLSTREAVSGASSCTWNQTVAWNQACSLLVDLVPWSGIATQVGSTTNTGTTTNTALRTVPTTNTGTSTTTALRTVPTTNTGTTTTTALRTVPTTNTATTTTTALRTVPTTNTGTTTTTALRTVPTTNTGTTTNTLSQTITTTNTGTTTATATRVGTSSSSGTTTTTATETYTKTQTATVTKTSIPDTVVLTSVANTTDTESKTAVFTSTATVTTTYAVHPLPDTDDCNVFTSCGGNSYCYLQSTKSCSSNIDCTFPGDFCRQVRTDDGTMRLKGDSCVASNPPNMICRYQAKSCTANTDCQGGVSGSDYCVTGASAQMCQKSGLWCSVGDTGTQCSDDTNDRCGPATSRIMMVKNAVRRVLVEHAYDDSVVKMGHMHGYQANLLGSTDNLFPYVKLAESPASFDKTETRFLSRAELLRGTDGNGKPCFVESTGPSTTCTIDYGAGGVTTTPSVVYTRASGNNSRYGVPTGDGKTFAYEDDAWGNCGLGCSFPSARTAGRGVYQGSYYTFTYRKGVPIDAGSDPNNPVLGSLKNPQYYSTYKGKSFGSVGNYWMLMDAERSDFVNENKYGARPFLGETWSNSAEYGGLPFVGASGDPLSTSVECNAHNGAQWDSNLVPMVSATTVGSKSVTPAQKALLNAARFEKASFGGFHAVGNIEPIGCALKNDGANDTTHSVEGYMNAVKTADAGACWQNHVLMIVDGLPRGPGDVAIGGIDCSADACMYDPTNNKDLAGCTCPAVTKARALAVAGINVHVIAATNDLVGINTYAAKTLNNVARAGSTSTGFINRPRYAANEDELYFWLNYEMKEALRVRVATTPASAANGSQSLAGITAGNMLYQTVAEPPEWRGTLIGYTISSSGGSVDAGTSTDVTYTTAKAWDAALANGWVPCSPDQTGCSVPDDYRWKSRKVFFSDTTGTVRLISVDSSGNVDSASKSALLSMGMGANDAETQRIVQWMLGKLDPSETLNPRPLNPAVMGSVINSMPISVGPPGMNSLPGGNHFYYTHLTRPELVYVGSDAGMLHAFRAVSEGSGKEAGTEAFAFIPADMVPVIAKLYAQGGQRYNPAEHIYGLSGSPKVKNLCVANCNPSPSASCSDAQGGTYSDGTCPVWKTILIMPEGQGGNHPFALDITDPLPGGTADLTGSLLWHVPYKNAAALPIAELGDTVSVPAFAYIKTADRLDQRVLLASSYPAGSHSYTKLLDAKLTDGSTSSGSGLSMSGGSCTQDFGMLADVALARDYTSEGEQSLIAAYLADTHGTVHQYAPAYTSAPSSVMSLGCNHPLHFSPAVVQLNRSSNINSTSVFLAQLTNSLLDPATRSSSTPSMLVVKKLTSIGNSPPAADSTFGTSGEIQLHAGTSCTGTNCLCGKMEAMKTSGATSCGSGGSTIPDSARPTGSPVAVIRSDGQGFQLYSTWYSPPASNWDNCQDSSTNGTSYITLHEFLANGTWAQIAGIEIPHQYVTGVQFVGTTLFVTYGMKDQGDGSPQGLPNLGQTFVSVDKVLQSLAGDRFVRTAWTERLDQ